LENQWLISCVLNLWVFPQDYALATSAGSQDALWRAFYTLVDEGDTVLCEAPTYSGARSLAWLGCTDTLNVEPAICARREGGLVVLLLVLYQADCQCLMSEAGFRRHPGLPAPTQLQAAWRAHRQPRPHAFRTREGTRGAQGQRCARTPIGPLYPTRSDSGCLVLSSSVAARADRSGCVAPHIRSCRTVLTPCVHAGTAEQACDHACCTQSPRARIRAGCPRTLTASAPSTRSPKNTISLSSRTIRALFAVRLSFAMLRPTLCRYYYLQYGEKPAPPAGQDHEFKRLARRLPVGCDSYAAAGQAVRAFAIQHGRGRTCAAVRFVQV